MSCISSEPLNISKYFQKARSLNLFLLEVFLERVELFEVFRRDGNPQPVPHEEARVRVKFMDLPCIEVFRSDAPVYEPSTRPPDPTMVFTRRRLSKESIQEETDSESTSTDTSESNPDAPPDEEVFDVREASKGVFSVRTSHDASTCKVKGCCLPLYKFECSGPGRKRGSKLEKIRAVGGGFKQVPANEDDLRGSGGAEDSEEVEEVFRNDAWNQDKEDISYDELSKSYAKEASTLSMGPGVTFNVASSYLFIHQPIQLLHMIQRYPLVFTVYFLTSRQPGVVGYSQIPLSDGFFEAVEQAVREPMPTIAKMTKILPIKTSSCELVGKMKITFSLTCFGEEAWTKLVSPEPNPNLECKGRGEAVEKTIVYTSSDRVRRQARRDVQRKPAIVCGIEHLNMPDEKYHDPCEDLVPVEPVPGYMCAPVTDAYIQAGIHLTEEALMCRRVDSCSSQTSIHSLPRTLSVCCPESPELLRVCGGEGALLQLIRKADDFWRDMEADPMGPMSQQEADLGDLLENPLAVPLPLTPWAKVHKAVCCHFPKRCRHFALYYPGRGFAKDPDYAYTLGYSELT